MRKIKKRGEKKKNNLFNESIEYIKESRMFILAGVIIFFASSLLGFIFSPYLGGIFNSLIADLMSQISGLGTFDLIVFIFKNNFSSSIITVFLGVFLGVFPIFNAILNGAILGYVAAIVSSQESFFALWRLLPHGIFELPAIFIAIGIGIKFGFAFFAEKGKVKKELLYRLDKSLKVVVFIILPLLIIAAIIEGLLIGIGS